MDDVIRLLPKILHATNNAEEILQTASFVAWRRASGETVREHAVPFRLYGKTLIIAVADIRWQQQLETLSGQLLFRINSLLGQPAVTYIEFRLDAETVAAERRRRFLPELENAAREARALACAASLETAAAAIKDENLRRKFLLAAGSSLARQEHDRQSKS